MIYFAKYPLIMYNYEENIFIKPKFLDLGLFYCYENIRGIKETNNIRKSFEG